MVDKEDESRARDVQLKQVGEVQSRYTSAVYQSRWQTRFSTLLSRSLLIVVSEYSTRNAHFHTDSVVAKCHSRSTHSVTRRTLHKIEEYIGLI